MNIREIEKKLKKLMCRVLDHRNDMSCIDKNFVYTNERCSRCGVDLPIAYPHHKEYGKYQAFGKLTALQDQSTQSNGK